MRSSQDSNKAKWVSSKRAARCSSNRTAKIFSSSTRPVNRRSARRTTKSRPCSSRSARWYRRERRRRSAVRHPCDWISSLKNHCTPWACSGEPSAWRMLRISAATLVGDRFRGIGSLLESLPQLGGSDSTHPNDFISAGLAGDDYEGGAGQVQDLCQELQAGLVCLAVDGRCRQVQFESVAEFANNRISSRP